ncbi:MAG: hypothetical protein ACKVX9_18415 [Blastocatellia bacterium]
MREERLIVMMLLCVAGWGFQSPIFAQDAAGRARQALAEARAALGGEKLSTLRSLSVEGGYRRMMGQGREMSGDVTYDLLLPDKMMRTETMRPFGDMEITRLEAMNGDGVWEDQQQSGGGGGMVMIRRGVGGGGGEDPKKAQEMAQQAIRGEFARFSLGLLLTTASSFPVEYAFAGEAESPDGKADVLDVTGPNGFAARLFLDQKSHRPLMLTYKGKKPRMVMHTATGGPPSQADVEKRIRESEAEAARSPDVEYQIRFSDYKEVNGISLPHRISKGIESETSEEIEFKKFKVNPQIKPEKFVKK